VVAAYATVLGARALMEVAQEGLVEGLTMGAALPTMHAAWAAGFFEGIVKGPTRSAG
jgi:hypothetical protein